MPYNPYSCGNHQAPAGYYYVRSTWRNGVCVLKKRSSRFRGVFGAVNHHIDPFTPAPTVTPLPPIKCGRHQAPNGYYYRLIAGKCMLWRKHPNTPLISPTSQAGTGFIYQRPIATGGLATGYDTVSNITDWVKNNKGLAALIGVGIYYALNKK